MRYKYTKVVWSKTLSYHTIDIIRIVGEEKESGMKEMLCIMGVTFRMQWAAWWARAAVFLIVLVLVLSATIAVIYNYVSFGVVFLLVLSYFVAFTALAFFITCW